MVIIIFNLVYIIHLYKSIKFKCNTTFFRILFYFHKNELGHVRAKVAPPRLNGERTGVFSTRSPHRPCPIGLSLVKIIKIQDYTIYFEGVDMVDQTPVLDIKPYIPHYDNPSHIEKVLQTVHLKEESSGIGESSSATSSFSNVDCWITNNVDETVSINASTTSYTENHRTSAIENHSPVHVSSSSSSSTSSLIDVSRDEELALRLQAEEFQDNLNFENVYINNDNSSILEDNELRAIIANRSNSTSVNYDATDSEMSGNDDQNLRNSRLLDGADGPSAVCGTDLDLIGRRALNLRLEDSSSSSSPIRMGVREAPDGEEGFDLSQPQNAQVSVSAVDSMHPNTSSQIAAGHTSENASDEAVRVPDWISRPKTSSLSVVFNERSILQLHEILNDKADEKRQAVENVLKEDPRSVYLRRRYGNQFYTFLIHDLHITCRFDDDRKIVTVFQIRPAGRMCECGQPEWQCPGHSPSSVFNQDQ